MSKRRRRANLKTTNLVDSVQNRDIKGARGASLSDENLNTQASTLASAATTLASFL